MKKPVYFRKYFFFLLITTCFFLIAKNVHAQSDFLDGLEGKWSGKGVLMGDSAIFSMNWERILEDKFFSLSFKNERISKSGDKVNFLAKATYSISNKSVQGTWFDSRGIKLNLKGEIKGDSLIIDWGAEGLEQGRTVYVVKENAIEVTDYVYQQGKMMKFGKASYTKVLEDKQEVSGKVIGIGGIFFKSKSPAHLRKWYNENLGVKSSDLGGTFVWRKHDNDNQLGYTVWHAFNEKDQYFNLSEKDFMINYRVDDIEKLLLKLKKNGVKVVGEVEEYPYGKFAWILDPDGQKVELWEAYDEEYLKMLKGNAKESYNKAN